jgi:cytochrome c-type biogenesis protein CcmH/NrfG
MAIGPGPSNAPARGATAGDDVLRQATFALKNGRPGEAERIASDVLKRDPRHPGALHVLGCSWLMQGRAADAIAPLQDAARARHDPEIDTQLAIALRQTGRNDEALSRLKRAIKRTPPYAMAFHELGFLLNSMGRFDDAVDALKRGLAIAPMLPELSIQLGNVVLEHNDRAGARAAFAHALSIRPNSADALSGLATALVQDGEFATAAEVFRDCLRLRPNDSLARTKLGICLLETGQVKAGYDCLRLVVRDDPKLRGSVLGSLVKSGHGRFWLKPSDALRFLDERG